MLFAFWFIPEKQGASDMANDYKDRMKIKAK